jgi:DNA transformation protein
VSEFVAYLEEVFREFGSISSRRMFGGYGVFYDGLMIGLVADDMLYLKVDLESEATFKEHGLPQFKYSKAGKMVGMSFYLAPEEALDDPTEMQEWAKLAYGAALRAKK